ncbi:MAG: hypothetical protein U9R16_02840 [Campylobacterota bacterium]|nr:hypothetical protein [Campylobacterota bacterium]
MKKYIILISALFVTTSLNAAMTWSQVVSWKNKTIKADAQYSVETEGYNVRVYEFTPLTDPGSTCIMTFTNEKMGMFCFAKSKDALKK